MGRPPHLVTHLVTTARAGCCAQEINHNKGSLHTLRETQETAPIAELLTDIFWLKLRVFLATLSESPTYLHTCTHNRHLG